MAQRLLLGHLRAIGLWHDYRVEYPFAEGRRFRFDIADMTSRIGYECDGGQWSGGHMRGKALESQYEKDRLAQILGWKVFRVWEHDLKLDASVAVAQVRRLLRA